MTRKRKIRPIATGAYLVLMAASIAGQNSTKPLTNNDVLAMVNKKMPESVIVSAIKTTPGAYDTSTNELIRLNSAGVTELELNAMIGVAHKASSADAVPAASNIAADPDTTPRSRMPRVQLMQGSTSQDLKLEKTQLAQTKNKPSSMKNLASDSVVTQAMQAGISTASWDAATHMNSVIGGSTVQEAGSIVSGMLAHRPPTVTYVWGVPGPASSNVVHTLAPAFSVDYSRAAGVNPDDFEPAVVKLTPAQNTCRIVGATQGKADAGASPAADWQVYSHYLEEPVTVKPQKLGPGKYKINTPELAPGEYGLVLRPISKTKKFSGGDVARAQGDGLMFDAIWTFQISDEAQ
ncbi:hypothetical protein P8935_02440 [Telmatobacter sp. DSM 110680]|uniref:Uncharacterized protein n=1 Tax=Telmatobacter sp. DSM 110680 TaxID=3036704 RepID=A0AAU7DK29_9BACT